MDSLGLARLLEEECNQRPPLSRMTFPHPLARVILPEQICRAFTILRGEQHHR